MPNASVLDNIVFSGHNYIDALLDHGPDWNYQNPGGNVITYTFSTASGNEAGETGQQAFSVSQQFNARSAMAYISSLTGIVFAETSNGTAANVHFCNIDIPDANTSALCSWQGDARVIVSTNELVSYKGSAYIYLDNGNRFGAQNANLTPGGVGYETLLHELGHMLGLKHPFETNQYNSNVLPFNQDNTLYSLLSYTEVGGPYTTFSQFDIAALDWLYGRDGLGGALGVGSVTGARYITGSFAADLLVGTGANDTLRGNQGDDRLLGGGGDDTAIFNGQSGAYRFTELADGTLRVEGGDGVDILSSVEILQFSDGIFRRGQLGDTSAPVAPSASVTKNGAGYVQGNTPFLAGSAEAGATVKVFAGATQVGATVADAQGAWSLFTNVLQDGTYSLVATATDGAGNVSPVSTALDFKVDVRAPAPPTGSAALPSGSNQPTFAGTGEAGATLTLMNGSTVIGQSVVDGAGNWSIAPGPLANDSYSIAISVRDQAGNMSSAASNIVFGIDSALNRVGTAGNDTLTGSAGNNALSGLSGIDTAVYAGPRNGYTVMDAAYGHTVTARSGSDGQDSLVDVERIRFSDANVAIDIDGIGGQAYRMYQAAFDRAPDLAGVGFWMSRMDQGASLLTVATAFIDQPEFLSLYGANSTNTTFVSKLYQHVLHRPLDQAGADFWLGTLERGSTRGEVLKGFSESNENVAQLVGAIANGFEYIPYLG